MTRGIEIAPIDRPGGDARVCHYDQLADGVKGRFAELAPTGDGSLVVETEDPADFDACDVVKFTRYYRVTSAPDHTTAE